MQHPRFVIAGAHKCATTTLHDRLDHNPAVAMSSVKEPHYLTRNACRERLHEGVWDTADYRRLWPGVGNETMTGESSVLYLAFAEELVETVRNELDAPPKFIVIIRNPVSRALSSYNDVRLKNPAETAPSFRQAVTRELERGPWRLDGEGSPTLRHLALGRYSVGLQVLIEAFGRDRVEVVLTEDFAADPDAVVRGLETFLGVPHDEQGGVGRQLNRGGMQWRRTPVAAWARSGPAVGARRMLRQVAPRLHAWAGNRALATLTEPASPMDEDLRGMLSDLYREEVASLEKLVGRDLQHWLPPEQP